MKCNLLLTCLAMLLICQANAQTNAPDSSASTSAMSLEACLDYAYQHNETLQNSRLDQGLAKADIGTTKSQGLPQIDASIDYTNNFAVPVVYLPASAAGAFNPNSGQGQQPGQPAGGQNGGSDEEVALRFGIQHQGSATLTATQMIFDGSYFVGLRAARTYAELMQKQVVQSKINIAEQVSKAYYTVLVNEERMKLVNSNFMRLDTLLTETQLMFENGFSEAIDVDRIRVQYNNAKSEKNRAIRLIDVSRLMLKFQMGMPLEQEVQLGDKISNIDVDSILNDSIYAYADRIDYRILQTNTELTQLDLRNNRIQYLPKLTANASYGYNTGVEKFNSLFNFDERWNSLGLFGVKLNIPIFDGLRKGSAIQKNKLQLQQLENSTKQLKNSIDLEVVQARVQLQDNHETLKIQQENLDLAERVYEVAKIKYQEGVGSNIEVVNAGDDLQAAETNYFGAMYDALIAKVDLEKALGKLIEE